MKVSPVVASLLGVAVLIASSILFYQHYASPSQNPLITLPYIISGHVPPSFSYYREVNITNSTGDPLEDFQVLITIDTASLISEGKMLPDCSDIRVADTTKQKIPYWVEKNTCNTTSTKIWTKVPYIPAGGSTTVYVYYGDPGASSESSADAVFEFFDDFDFKDTSKWDYVSARWRVYGLCDSRGTLTKARVSNSAVVFEGSADGERSLRSRRLFNRNIVIESVWRRDDAFSNHYVYISKDPRTRWSSDPVQGVIRCGWDWDKKYIHGQSSTVSVVRDYSAKYYVKISILEDRVLFYDRLLDDPSNENLLELRDTLGDGFYIFIGADNTFFTSEMPWIRVRKYAEREPIVTVGPEKLRSDADS